MKAAAGPGGVYMAGGIDVVNRLKSGLPVTDLIHLGLVAGLAGIEEVEDGLRLGALVTHDFSLVYVAQNNALETPLFYSAI